LLLFKVRMTLPCPTALFSALAPLS
jgi:hypothetical protein